MLEKLSKGSITWSEKGQQSNEAKQKLFLLVVTGLYLERSALQRVAKETVLHHTYCAEI